MKIEITKKSIFNLLTLIIFGATWFAIGWVLSNRKVEPESHRVSQVQKLIQTEYYDEAPSARQLSDAAIEGMLREQPFRQKIDFLFMLQPCLYARTYVWRCGRLWSGCCQIHSYDYNLTSLCYWSARLSCSLHICIYAATV